MISLLGFDQIKTQLLCHLYLHRNNMLEEEQASFLCPFCGVSSILNYGSMNFTYNCERSKNEFFITCEIKCSNNKCRNTTVVIERFTVKELDTSSLYAFIDKEGFIKHVNMDSIETKVVYPDGDFVKIIDYGDDKQFIPQVLLDDYIEIQKTANVSDRATLVLARRLIEKILIDKYPNHSSHKNLKEMIECIGEDSINRAMMDDLRIIGNKAIHVSDPNDAIQFNHNDSELAIHVLNDLLHEFYIDPGNRDKRREKLSELKTRAKGEAIVR